MVLHDALAHHFAPQLHTNMAMLWWRIEAVTHAQWAYTTLFDPGDDRDIATFSCGSSVYSESAQVVASFVVVACFACKV